jgi:hypothetical protein
MIEPTVIVSLLLAGCGSDPGAVGPVVPEGEWTTTEQGPIVVHSRPDDTSVCDAQVSEFSGAAEALRAFLGLDGEVEPIEWYRFRDSQDFDASRLDTCGASEDLSGCLRGSTIYAPPGVIEHELVHAVSAVLATPPSLFREGLAVALSCSPGPGLLPEGRGGWRDSLHGMSSYQSGAFVAHLLGEHGVDAVVELYRALDGLEAPDDVARAFQETLSVSIDEVWVETFDGRRPASCLPALACGRALATESSDCASLFPGGSIGSRGLYDVRVETGVAALYRCDLPAEEEVPARFSESHGAVLLADQRHAVRGIPHIFPTRFSVIEHAARAERTCADTLLEVGSAPSSTRLVLAPPVNSQSFEVLAPSAGTLSVLPDILWEAGDQPMYGNHSFAAEGCRSCAEPNQLEGCRLGGYSGDKVFWRVTVPRGPLNRAVDLTVSWNAP